MPLDPLHRFHPLIRAWFTQRLGEPTDVQLRAWEEVSAGHHVLITAPTGSGKTLAAFLWAINQLVSGAWPRGAIRILYVSPLKALNNDVQRNLLTPLAEIGARFRDGGHPFPPVTVLTRSGDTPGSDRQRMLRHPPEILITTPESLNILLTAKGSRPLLDGIATVILDEIHAVADGKRGTHLITAVERLVPLAGEFQRIALSATVRPLETMAQFVGGLIRRGDYYEKRPVAIVRGERAKEYRLTIRAPENAGDEDEFWPPLVRECRKIIAENRATLFFANSRRTTERLTRLLNEGEPEDLAYAHHGSLSREIRLAVEDRLKRGELKAIVATNTLELGIDIGRLDSVVLIQSPRSIASAIQRIGRSGHGVGQVSQGILFPTHGTDFIAAAVLARAITEREIEELRPVEAPLDILAQIILSMALPEEWDLDELYRFLRTSYPYRNLSRRHFDLVIRMLEGRYADTNIAELKPRVSLDRVTNRIATRPGVATMLYLEGGTIPERGYFELRLKEGGAKIGELDEEFVWERRLGDTFSLGAQVWQITAIGHNAVEVVPARKSQQIIPFWRAEEVDRSFFFAEKIGLFLAHCNERLADDEEFLREVTDRYAMDVAAGTELLLFLRRQKEATGTDLPHRHHLLVEHYHDPLTATEGEQVILHTLWGNSINRPFTLALTAAWEKTYGHPLQAFYHNDGIALLLPHQFHGEHLFSLVTPENMESLLRSSLEKSGYFGARFRENAGRALLLSKVNFKRRMPLWLNRLRSRKLFASVLGYQDFPLLLETWRSCLNDDFDLPTLKNLLAEIQAGEIVISETATTVPSPFASGLIWRQTNKYMYEDDTPDAGTTSALGQDLIRELVFAPHLRPRLPAPLIRVFEEKRQRTAEGYSPDSGREVTDWVKERLLLPADEWQRLLAAMERDHDLPEDRILVEVAERVVRLEVPGAQGALVGSLERLPEIAAGLGRDLDQVRITPLIPGDDVREAVERAMAHIVARHRQSLSEEPPEESEPAPFLFLRQWLSFFGPIQVDRVAALLGMDPEFLAGTLRDLEGAGQILLDRFREESTAPEICTAANLETLLRILRRSRQPAFQALEIRYLPLFLATFQGVNGRGTSLAHLQQRLEQLFGLPLPAHAWEEEVLPARLEPYLTAWLDSLMQTSGLLWFGCGDKRLAFAFPEDLDLFRGERELTGEAGRPILPDPHGRYSMATLRTLTGLPGATLHEELWQKAWRGEVSNDSFAAIRRAILNRFAYQETAGERGVRRVAAHRWQMAERSTGSWYLLAPAETSIDPLDREELIRERVRLLLDRYGILFRELLLRELPPLQWQRLFRTLRLMELSGEVMAGTFFSGIPGIQFISPEAYRLLTKGLDETGIYWLNAADPASLCATGLNGLKEELPPRVTSSHLVYHGTRLVLVSRRYGKELTITCPPDDPHLHSYLDLFRVLLGREFNPRKQILLEEINGRPAAESPYRQILKEFGFQGSYKGLELWRRY